MAIITALYARWAAAARASRRERRAWAIGRRVVSRPSGRHRPSLRGQRLHVAKDDFHRPLIFAFRAELDDFARLLANGDVAGGEIVGVAGVDNLLVVGVAHAHPPPDDIAPV